MEDIHKNKPKANDSPFNALDGNEKYVTTENIKPGQHRGSKRFDSDDSEVYLTPQHLIDNMSTDLSSHKHNATTNASAPNFTYANNRYVATENIKPRQNINFARTESENLESENLALNSPDVFLASQNLIENMSTDMSSHKNNPKRNSSTFNATYVNDEYGTKENIKPRQHIGSKRFDSDDSEVYLTPQHLIDNMSTDLSDHCEIEGTEGENENMRPNILGHWVPKKDHGNVDDQEYEDGYEIVGRARTATNTQLTFPSNTISTVNKSKSTGSKLFKTVKSKRCITIAVLIGCLSAGIIAYIVYGTKRPPNLDPGNFMFHIVSNHVTRL